MGVRQGGNEFSRRRLFGHMMERPSPSSLINSLPVRCCRVLHTIQNRLPLHIWRADYRGA
ncbi:hypothetical protein KCP74_21605 [Salmonella enterica subsp. enterica]|nr:hypothetical protein KCP74_21605 [Salmonella enterica subsp. enterica]